MNVSAPFIWRPVATSLIGIAILLGGLIGYRLLPVSSLPQVDFPTIQITTQLPGANPDTMAALVTAPLERQLGQIPSLGAMTSQSAFGISQITLQFDLERDIDSAAQDVQAAINAAGSTLPRNLPFPPTYAKVNPADAPIVTLALTSSTYTLRQLSDMADTLMGQRLSEITGVGHVAIRGGVRPAIRIQADLSRLANYGIGLDDLRTAVVAANVSGPKGALDGVQQSWTLAANDQLEAASAYRSLIVAYRNGSPVLLADVADVVEGLENAKVGGWYRGQPAVIIDIMRQPGANVIETVKRIHQELPRLERMIPTGMTLDVVHDRTGTIRASIHDVQFTLALSVALVVLVVLLFLRTARTTLIAGVALPLSLIATFGVMWLLGFSLDNLSLMALTIGTGFVVDDAIVMIENIVRHIEKGERPLQAALKGSQEIGFTVISLTLSLVAVFIPLLFMTGIVGRMFREFAMTLTIAVVASMIVSLTLTPMMCARLLRPQAEGDDMKRGLLGLFDRGFEWTTELYRTSLAWSLKRQPLMMASLVITLVATIVLYVAIPKGFMPIQDTGLVTAVLKAEPSVSFERMKALQLNVTQVLERDPDVAAVASFIGIGPSNLTANTGRLTLVLKPRETRSVDAPTIINRLQRSVSSIPGVEVSFLSVQDVQITTRQSTAQYQYSLTGTDRREVSEWAGRLAAQMARDRVFRDVVSEAQDGAARLFVHVDRENAARLGVSVQAVNDALNNAFGQRQISTVYAQANQYRVILEAQPRYQSDTQALDQLYVTGTGGAQVPLAAIATFEPVIAALLIGHDAQFPSVTISFNVAQGWSLGDAVTAIGQIERTIGMPDSLIGRFSGDAAEFSRALESQPWLVLAALITIYIVLGVLYESVFHPITILSTLPSAGVGALIALLICGLDLSIVALIGIVLLMGIVKKNAIMMIDFALAAERERGLSPRVAIEEACLLRFRPIMMTSFAALFGALPLALGTGQGAELRVPLGVTIIGGLVLSQLLTLYTTPAVYLAVERFRHRLTGVPAASPLSKG